jgi:hypothetical protein
VVIALECEGKVHGPRHDLDECHLIIARQGHEEEEEEDLKRPKYSSQNDAKREDTCYTTLTNTQVHASPYGCCSTVSVLHHHKNKKGRLPAAFVN